MPGTIGAAVLLMALLLAPIGVESLDNPLNLTLEQDLDQSSAKIAEFWARGSQGELQGKGGVRLSYWMYPRESRDATRAAIVIANGRTESFVKNPELFIERDEFRVSALTTILQFFGPP